jgi:hypothetical protein
MISDVSETRNRLRQKPPHLNHERTRRRSFRCDKPSKQPTDLQLLSTESPSSSNIWQWRFRDVSTSGLARPGPTLRQSRFEGRTSQQLPMGGQSWGHLALCSSRNDDLFLHGIVIGYSFPCGNRSTVRWARAPRKGCSQWFAVQPCAQEGG